MILGEIGSVQGGTGGRDLEEKWGNMEVLRVLVAEHLVLAGSPMCPVSECSGRVPLLLAGPGDTLQSNTGSFVQLSGGIPGAVFCGRLGWFTRWLFYLLFVALNQARLARPYWQWECDSEIQWLQVRDRLYFSMRALASWVCCFLLPEVPMAGVLVLVQSIQKCSSAQCECSSTEIDDFLDGIEGAHSRMLSRLAALWDIQCTTKKNTNLLHFARI